MASLIRLRRAPRAAVFGGAPAVGGPARKGLWGKGAACCARLTAIAVPRRRLAGRRSTGRNGQFACSAAGPIWKGERVLCAACECSARRSPPLLFLRRWVDASPVKCLSNDALETAVLATAPTLHVIGYTPEALGHDMFGRYERQVGDDL